MRTYFMGLLSEEPYSLYVTKSTFPTYDQLEARFKEASSGMEVQGADIVEFDEATWENFYTMCRVSAVLYLSFYFYMFTYVWFNLKSNLPFRYHCVSFFIDNYVFIRLLLPICACYIYNSMMLDFVLVYVWCRLSCHRRRF